MNPQQPNDSELRQKAQEEVFHYLGSAYEDGRNDERMGGDVKGEMKSRSHQFVLWLDTLIQDEILKARKDENEIALADFRLEFQRMIRPHTQGRLTEKGEGCYVELANRNNYHELRIAQLNQPNTNKEESSE